MHTIHLLKLGWVLVGHGAPRVESGQQQQQSKVSHLVVDVLLPRGEDVALDAHLGAQGLLGGEVEHVVVAQVVGRGDHLIHITSHHQQDKKKSNQ